MKKAKVLVTVCVFTGEECREARRMLEERGYEVLYNQLGRNYTLDDLKDFIGEVDAVIPQGDRWDEPIFQLAKQLRIIARFGVGYDNVDIAKAREYGIDVTNARVPELSSGVAELALGLMIAMLRDIPGLDASTKRGEWIYRKGGQIRGKTIGLVGFGAIAQSLAKKLSGFDATILACDKAPNLERAADLGVTFVPLDELLGRSDIVSLHTPSNRETYHLIGERELAAMKPGAYLVNTSRGLLVDEGALYRALVSGRLAGAATDVFEQEPTDPKNPLLGLDRFLCLPHVAGNTYEAIGAIARDAAQSVIDRLEGRPLRNLVNP